MSDTSDHLFNFLPDPTPSRNQSERRLNLGLKRKATPPVYSFIKKPHRHGIGKVIKIEIYDGDKLETNYDQVCKCDAELCTQYIVKNVLLDEVYESTRRLIDKIEVAFSSDASNGYTIL